MLLYKLSYTPSLFYKKRALSVVEVPETSTFTTFLLVVKVLVFKWVKSAIFQINTDPTKLARNWYFYTLYLPSLLHFPVTKVFRNIYF